MSLMTTTATRPATAVGAPPAEQRSSHRAPAAQRSAASVLVLLMVLLVLTQRIAIPLGGSPVPLALPLTYLAAGLLVVSGHLRTDRVRLELFAVAGLLCLLATTLVFLTGGSGSLTSIGLLLAVWLPFVLRAGPGQLGELWRVARAFVDLMVVLALVASAQLVAQFAGVWRYADYVGQSLPNLVQRTYNHSIPLFYASPIYKGNAFVFLEPSFLSQFCALAVAVALVVRAPWWKLLALVAGLASAVSGTGIVLLAVIAVLLLARQPRLLTRGVVLTALGVLVAISVSPVTPLLLERTGEFGEVGSSGYLRFVQPWTEVAEGLDADPERYLIGSGPGDAQRELESDRGGTVGQAVVYAIVPKLVFEYGVVAGGFFTLFILVALLDRMPWKVVPGALVVMLFFLSGSLLQPQTLLVGWLLSSVWTEQGSADSSRRWRVLRSRAAARR